MIKITTTILTMTILIAGVIAPALNNASVFAATNIVTNGSFENVDGSVTCPLSGSLYFQIGPSPAPLNPTIDGWTVGGNSIDWICGYWASQDGSANLDMSGYSGSLTGTPSSAGSVSQDLATIVDATYDVVFYMSGNTDGGSTVKQLTATASPYSGPFTYDTSGHPSGTDWQMKSFSFTATGVTTPLAFTSNEDYPFGPALDNVSVVLSACPTGFEISGDTCVQSNNNPVCDNASATPATLWSPNHKMVSIAINGVTDDDSDPINITVNGVTQDEPTNAKGDGDKSPDATLSPLQVRSERSGTGDGRVYAIAFTADDGQGGSCTGTVNVSVPHDQAHPTAQNTLPAGIDSTLP